MRRVAAPVEVDRPDQDLTLEKKLDSDSIPALSVKKNRIRIRPQRIQPKFLPFDIKVIIIDI